MVYSLSGIYGVVIVVSDNGCNAKILVQ